MQVKCTITEYSTSPTGPAVAGKATVQSVFADHEMVEIVIDNETHKFCAKELVSAIGKCQLNCFEY